jgi:phosphoribosylaminoimidazole carboxylase (NCAIR synthetase)
MTFRKMGHVTIVNSDIEEARIAEVKQQYKSNKVNTNFTN